MTTRAKAARDGGLGTEVAGRGGAAASGGVPGERYHAGATDASGAVELPFGAAKAANRGRFVGLVKGTDGHAAGGLWAVGRDMLYRRVLTVGRHLSQQSTPSLCFDLVALHAARAAGATITEIVDRYTGRTWRMGLRSLLARGERVDRGRGAELRLAIAEFDGPPLAPVTAEGPDEETRP